MIIPRLQNLFTRNNSTRRLRAFLLGLFAAGMTALPLKAAELFRQQGDAFYEEIMEVLRQLGAV